MEPHLDIKRDGQSSYPKKSKELAELMGIIFGDGCITIFKRKDKNSIDYNLTISGHSVEDREYLTSYVSSLIEHIFNVKPKVKYAKTRKAMFLRVVSKPIVLFLVSRGAQQSPKTNLVPPSWILSNKSYMRFFVRGLMDTDGSLAIKKRYREYPYYPTIKICSKDKSLILPISEYLKSLNFNVCCYLETDNKRGNKIHKLSLIILNGKKELFLWLKKIGLSNPKHYNKINLIENGSIKMGTVGFEPATSTASTWCSPRLSYVPD